MVDPVQFEWAYSRINGLKNAINEERVDTKLAMNVLCDEMTRLVTICRDINKELVEFKNAARR